MTESNPDGFINKPTRDDVIFAVSQGSGSGNTPITLNTNQVLTED
jgi:hypothetical protein